MKQGWEIKKLGDITTSINGLWTGKKPPFITIAVIRNTNFTKDCKLDTSDIAYIDVEVKQYASRKLQCGDIIIEKSGGSDKQPVGRPILFNIEEGEYSFSNFTSTMRVNDKAAILPEFIHRYLAYIYARGDTAAMQSKTTGIRNLDFNLYKSIQVPVPPREEQERIVEELDCLSGIIERKRDQLRELDALAQSIFYQMFGDPITNEKGWEVKPLKNSVFEMFLGPFGSALKTDCYVSKEDAYCMVYEQKHAIKKTMELETHYIDKDKFESLKRFEVHSGDFIMSCRGTIGEIYRLPNNAPIGIIHPSLMKIRIKEDVYHPTFFIRLLTHIVKNENTNGNCVQMAITAKELGARTPITPPLTLQHEFADKIEAIEKQKELIKQSITQTEELFNSRMDYYFN